MDHRLSSCFCTLSPPKIGKTIHMFKDMLNNIEKQQLSASYLLGEANKFSLNLFHVKQMG
ncbi:hypothetical protein LBR02_11830 [Levilactobacillus brevis]|nr:hypothetical protein LBR02_11830 [Levilactobacillus brevis]